MLELVGCSLELLGCVEDVKGTRGPSVSGLGWQSWLGKRSTPGYRQGWLGTVSVSSPGWLPSMKVKVIPES